MLNSMEEIMGPEEAPPPSPPKEARGLEWYCFNIKKREIVLGMAALLIIGGFFMFRNNAGKERAYEEIYMLVPDKISQSAAVVVRLPEGIKVNAAEASQKISFNPALSGNWVEGKNPEYLVFQPKQALDVGKHYLATLVTADLKIQKDFLADEDPKIVSVFPNDNSESSEYSKITIIFNRPMVPLTTLDVLQDKDIPVEINPPTLGKYKWITTRNLQFIPDTRLKRSSHYTVNVKAGFVSMDALVVSPQTHKFNTRPLRYEGEMTQGAQTLYNQPIRIVFNQPVDVGKTANELNIKKASGENVPFVVAYGTRSIYDTDSKKYNKFVDKSILEIYGKNDRYGRAKFWDFSTSYNYALKKAYPAEGEITLDQPRSGNFSVGEIISSISAESSRSKFVEPDLFDPEGKLWVTFFEDIDKDASLIAGDNIKEIGYDETCQEPDEGEEISYGSDCPKVPDFKRIFITFDPDGLQSGQQIPIHFKKIYNKAGLQINAEELNKTITIYPKLVIYKTVPGNGAIDADLTQMKVCTSNPLQVPDETTFDERVKSNITVGLWNWYSPYRVQRGDPRAICAVGQFENTIQYGLVPEFQYAITLNAIDDFGQETEQRIHFTSGKLSVFSRNLSHLQKEYNVTSPDRLKFSYAADNLEYVDLTICEVSPETMLRYIEERPKASAPPSSLNCKNVTEKRIDLPKKYWSRVYFQVNLADYLPNPIGHYILSFGHPDYRNVRQERNQATGRSVEIIGERIYERTYVTVTQLAVQEKKIQSYDASLAGTPLQNLYWISQFGTLNPVVDASVDLYRFISLKRYGPDKGMEFRSE